MKVLLVNGSPHKEGNTYLALKEVAKEIEKYGVETEIFHIGTGPVQGCIACNKCHELGTCVFSGDVAMKLQRKMQESDGFVFGTPTYYAGPNGTLCAILDRVFYSAGGCFRAKPASAIAVCRRGGATTALERLEKYITIGEMPYISSQYWNIIYGRAPGEVLQDEEGLQTMRALGKNMAYAVKNLPASECPKLDEQHKQTNFIR